MNVLIAGMGFVGVALANFLAARGDRVFGLTHSAESRDRLRAETVHAVEQADLAELDDLRCAVEAFGQPMEAVVHCASSGRAGAEGYRKVYFDGCRNLLGLLPHAQLLFTSSTSVYAQTQGEWVEESSPTEPDRETGQILRQTEDLVWAGNGIVARLAGIYGPGRSVLLRKFLDGTAVIEGDGARSINQVHRDDIVRALALLLVTPEARPGIFNVADDLPQSQRAVYAWLAEHFGRPLPPTGPPDLNRKRGWTHKQVSNRKLRALGWVPKYPSFQDAIRSGAVAE